jgi:DNA uptake protein ComE-like DNA-binding protein
MLGTMMRVPWWVWVSATPFGLGSWTPIIPGRELRRRSWVAWGVLWITVTIAGWVAAVVSDGGAGGGLMIILGWCGAIATTLSIRPSYVQQSSSSFTREREAAELRLRERREAQQLAAEKPELALELGIGRPDRPGAQAAGLVDVNNASISALLGLPGIDDALAHRIVELREELDGFGSVHDLGSVLELDGNAVERLRDRTVFLPR